MSISGKQPINVGLPNESVGSDSLYVAFNKVNTNFNTLFACASPYNTFAAGNGISTNANSSSGVLTITNTGVTSLNAGTGITLSGSNGNITISANTGGNGGGGTITSLGLLSNANRITVSTSTTNPIVANGNFTIDLATSGVNAGSYTNPTLTVDSYGRITAASNNSVSGTVTSIGLVAVGSGLSISGSPVTSNGTITIENTGVTRIKNGGGLIVTGTSGEVTLAVASTGGTVTSVGVTSNSLTVTNSPVVSAGSINVEIPSNVTVTGRLLLNGSEDLADGAAANLSLTATYFSTGATGETGTLAAGTNGLVKTFMMVADGGGDMVITVTNAGWKTSGTGTMTFGDIGDGCTLQYINSKWFCIGNNGVVFA